MWLVVAIDFTTNQVGICRSRGTLQPWRVEGRPEVNPSWSEDRERSKLRVSKSDSTEHGMPAIQDTHMNLQLHDYMYKCRINDVGLCVVFAINTCISNTMLQRRHMRTHLAPWHPWCRRLWCTPCSRAHWRWQTRPADWWQRCPGPPKSHLCSVENSGRYIT